MSVDKRKMAVCMLGRMGDLIAVEPMFRAIAAAHSDCWRVWYTTVAFASIYRGSPLFHEVVVVSDQEDYLAQKAGFPPDAIVYEFNLKGRKVITRPGETHSQFPLLFGLTGNCPVSCQDEGPRFYLREDAIPPVSLPGRYAVFHCASNGRRRQYPAAHWDRLAKLCMAEGVSVVEVGLHPILTCPGVISCTGRLDLQVAAKIMQGASLFVGMESGFAHMANAFGVFGVIIAGKLKNYPDYNPYTGYYSPAGNGCNMVRFYDEFPLSLPVDLPAEVLLRALRGEPMKYDECAIFCLKHQVVRLQRNPVMRLLRKLAEPLYSMKLSLLAHRNKHH